MAHVGLIGLQVQVFSAGVAGDLAQLDVAINRQLDAADVRRTVIGGLQFAGNVGESGTTATVAI